MIRMSEFEAVVHKKDKQLYSCIDSESTVSLTHV
jgi:hypothetical protein